MADEDDTVTIRIVRDSTTEFPGSIRKSPYTSLIPLAYERQLEQQLRVPPSFWKQMIEESRQANAARWAATPWHRKLRIKTRRHWDSTRRAIARRIYQWDDPEDY